MSTQFSFGLVSLTNLYHGEKRTAETSQLNGAWNTYTVANVKQKQLNSDNSNLRVQIFVAEN